MSSSNKSAMVSFEFFPGRASSSHADLMSVIGDLSKLKPDFNTITFGAAGSTIDGTFKTVVEAQKKYAIPCASHITAVAMPRSELLDYADALWREDIRRLVVLRGDIPQKVNEEAVSGDDYFTNVPDFISALAKLHPFEISVSAYPETHPKAKSRQADIDHLKAKFDLGATRAITQFFFDNDDYFRFLEECESRGVRGDIVPGILPIHNIGGMRNFAAKCGARVPEKIISRFAGVEAGSAAHEEIAAQILSEQVSALARGGVRHIHVYTLNKVPLSRIAVEAFRQAFI